MAEHRCEVESRALGGGAAIKVVVPETPPPAGGYPTLYLMHGLDDDGSAWLSRTAIARRAAERGLALVLPPIGESFATDEVRGRRYWTFLSTEVRRAVAARFPVSSRRVDTAVAGVSMGGYAAVKWALRQPRTFGSAVSLSGSLDIADPDRYRRRPELMRRIFGDRPIPGTPNDLFWLLEQLDASTRPRPALYIACGEQDSHLGENRRFLDAAAAVSGLSLTTRVGAGGHDWNFWDGLVDDVVGWLAVGSARREAR